MSPRLLQRVLGRAAGRLTRDQNPAGESLLGDVFADAVQTGVWAWSRGVASLVSLSEIRGDLPRDRSAEQAVELRFRDVYHAVPLGQGFISIDLTGAQLHAALEQQFTGRDRPHVLQVSAELRYTWDPARPAGSRVDPATLTIGGTPVVAATRYRLTVSEYLWRGGAGFTAFAQGQPMADGARTGQHFDLLAAYLGRFDVVPLPALDRITRA